MLETSGSLTPQRCKTVACLKRIEVFPQSDFSVPSERKSSLKIRSSKTLLFWSACAQAYFCTSKKSWLKSGVYLHILFFSHVGFYTAAKAWLAIANCFPKEWKYPDRRQRDLQSLNFNYRWRKGEREGELGVVAVCFPVHSTYFCMDFQQQSLMIASAVMSLDACTPS